MPLELTVIMCEFRHPNYMAGGLDGLIRNSVTRPRILVPFSDPGAFGLSQANDFLINPETGEKEQRFSSVYDYIEKCGTWAGQNNIEFIDLTGGCQELRQQIEARGETYQGGHDCAYKNNWAANLARSEIIVPNYDDDFYPSPGWDAALLGCVERNNNPQSTWVATHVQPRVVDNPGDWVDIEETRQWHCNLLGWPRADSCIVTREEWNQFFTDHRSARLIMEPCGARQRAHCNPQALRTEDYLKLGGFPVEVGMDPHFDSRLGELGYLKHSTYEAFILHKGWVRGSLLADE